jgi:hypothetical protein
MIPKRLDRAFQRAPLHVVESSDEMLVFLSQEVGGCRAYQRFWL